MISRATCAVSIAVTLGVSPLTQAPDRSKPPAPGPAPSFRLPPVQKRTLSNGLPVWIVEMHEVPVVDLALIIKSGAAADPAGRYGLASFTAAMLDEGAGTRNALELADAVEFLGASLSTSSSWDSSRVRLHTPTARFDAALPLWADVILRPSFPETEIERLRKERVTSILQTRDSVPELAETAYARVLYGPNHRYGTPAIGSEASNVQIASSELKGFYQSHYQPQNANLLVVGDVRPDSVLKKLEEALGSWQESKAIARATLPAATQHGPRQIYLVDKPGAAQSAVGIGWIGVPRSTPDYFVLDVMNTILGGSFTSRLNQNLREQHGYAYGAFSIFDMRATAGPFVAGATVQTDKTTESLREFFKELEGMRQTVPSGELTRARNLQALSFPAAFETTTGMADKLSELAIYALGESFFDEYVGKIQSVTAAEVERAAKQYVQSDKFAVVVVGDLSKIEKPIRDANLGPVKIVVVDAILK